MHLTGGNCHDASQGRVSIEKIGEQFEGVLILMDRAYEGEKTQELCYALGHGLVVPLKKNRIIHWNMTRNFASKEM